MSMIVFNLPPVPKPRQTQQDKYLKRPCVMRYRAFENTLRLLADRADFRMPESGASVVFHLPMPASWSEKRRGVMVGTPHRQTPDVDNLLKAFLDTLCANDCAIWSVSVEKRWAVFGRIDVTITPINP